MYYVVDIKKIKLPDGGYDDYPESFLPVSNARSAIPFEIDAKKNGKTAIYNLPHE